jgi:DNA polymerase-3 subunit delta
VDVVAAARSLPMLGERRVVIVLRAERWLKPKRAGGAKDGDDENDEETTPGAPKKEDAGDFSAIEAYLEAPSEFSVLLFVAADIDRTRRLTKRLLEKSLVTEFAGLSLGGQQARPQDVAAAADQWVREELTRVGRAIDRDAARLLAVRAGGDISKLRGDVERLLLFIGTRKTISIDDVMEVVSEGDVDDDWAVVNAIAAGDTARALSETGRRLDRGDSPHQMLGQLRWWVSARLSEGEPRRVKPAIDALLRTDLALKSSGGDGRVLIERLVVELTGKPLPQRGGWR